MSGSIDRIATVRKLTDRKYPDQIFAVNLLEHVGFRETHVRHGRQTQPESGLHHTNLSLNVCMFGWLRRGREHVGSCRCVNGKLSFCDPVESAARSQTSCQNARLPPQSITVADLTTADSASPHRGLVHDDRIADSVAACQTLSTRAAREKGC